MNEVSEKTARERSSGAEDARRSPSGDLEVLPFKTGVTFDWGAAGIKIDVAKHHLDESIPNGQMERTQNAFLLMRQGVEELACFLRAKGVKV
jgi:hypothetical protein